MADKSTQLVLDALGRAMADPGGMPLHGSKKAPGLFPTTATAKQTAQRCLAEGYLRAVGSETLGRSTRETCAITEKGLTYLLGQASPKKVLEELVRALDARQVQVGELVAAVRQWQAGMDVLRTNVAKVLQEILKAPEKGTVPLPQRDSPLFRTGPLSGVPGPTPSDNGSGALLAEVVSCLTQWRASGASGDCPLPELYSRVRRTVLDLSIGHFHDGLRRLHEQERIYLHPWTGPLYDLPEPPCALLVGHEVAYYSSIRQ